MKTIITVLLLTLVSCSVGRKGVYFEEMPTQPSLRLTNDVLTVNTSNSTRNSALSIYKINVSVDHSKKEVYLSAYQAVGKDCKTTFTIQLHDFTIAEPTSYSFYWLDPDKKTIQLSQTTEKQ